MTPEMYEVARAYGITICANDARILSVIVAKPASGDPAALDYSAYRLEKELRRAYLDNDQRNETDITYIMRAYRLAITASKPA